MTESRKSKISTKREKRVDSSSKTTTKEAPKTYGYSVKLSSSDGTTKKTTKQTDAQALGSINPTKRKPTPEEVAKMRAEMIKKMQNDPKAREQMQKAMREQIKKLPFRQRVTKLSLMFSMQKLQAAVMGSMKAIDEFVSFVVKKDDSERNEVIQKARPPILFGMWVAIITFCIFGVWAGIAPLDSASGGLGVVVVDSSRKLIQHKEGGIVDKIFVKDGDHVKKGQPLMKLSEASLKPQLDANKNREINYRAWLDRLDAERDGRSQVIFSDDLINKIQDPEINQIIMNQQSQFESRQETIEGKLSGIDQKIAQMRQETIAAKAQKESTQTQLKLVQEQVKVLRDLYEKGLAQKPRLIEQQSREAQLIAGMSEIDSKIMKIEQSITEMEIEKKNVRSQFKSEISREIRDVQEKLIETQETIKSIKDQFNRLEIKSPIEGTVSKVQIQTIGAVIPPGMQVMTIIPEKDNLVIDAFVRPQDIDSVYVGLKAKVRISAFKARSTGPLEGIVTYVSPDLTEASEVDKVYNLILQQMQGPAYKVRIKVDKAQLKKISKYRDYELHPGMQADVMIVTGERTLLQYLLDPVTSTFWHAFVEK
ncbi:MAG: HlyD family type I secretion periplasmic adaptor subunit [Rickettsiales bacterium]